jgi:hypothetical protein
VAAATFFEHQRLARRNTKVMVLLFILAVVAVIAAVDLVLAGAWMWGISEFRPAGGKTPTLLQQFNAVPKALFLWGAIGTGAVIFSS